MTFLVTRFDFRAPGADPVARQELFSRALDQAAYAEAHGQDALTLSEHHGSDDGYLPSPLTVAAAMAARTRSLPISVAALVVNLHDPVRLAEDVAVLDHLSAGRVTYTLGLGYRREEYEMFGRPWHSRADDVETAIATLRAAWAGEPVERDGHRVRVTPVPFSRPHPVLLYGGGSAAAARRAARLALGFQPQVSDRGLRELYRAECRRLGREPGPVVMPPRQVPAFVFCTEDPDRFWALHGHHLLADAVATSTWHGSLASAVKDRSTTVAGLRAAGRYAVLTPAELVDRCRSGEVRLITSHPLCAGLPAEPSWESLRLLGEVVVPALRTESTESTESTATAARSVSP
jgi:alkanesulfonate monooxygenase SsuD/methylene tetrahydromethanopterin reductase-like flavin-dependent oxidoreductase (luciferase family)